MPAKVRLAGRLPSGHLNGLDSITDQLITTPDRDMVALIWFDVATISTDVDSGEDTPTVRVRRVEPIGPLPEVPEQVTALAEQLFERRTGRKALPFDQPEFDEDAL